MKKGGLVLILLLGLAVCMSAGCGSASAIQTAPTPMPAVADLTGVTAEGRLEPIRFVDLAPSVDGLVSEVLVSAGQQVVPGQLLARLDSTNAQTLETAQTEAALELGSAYEAVRVAQSEFDVYPLPRIFAGLSAQEASRTWLAELDAARAAFSPYKNTSRKTLKPSSAFSGFVYPSLPHRVLYDTGEYDEVAMVYKKHVDIAWMNYTKAVQWLKLDSALATAKARLADAQRRYQSLHDASISEASMGTRSALATAEIRAPFAGTIAQLDLKVGELAKMGHAVVTIADLSGWIVKTGDLTEIDVVSISEGMEVTVSLDSLPDDEFRGRVLSVDLNYSDRQGDVVYPVRILLAERQPDMRWGMTAQVTFGG